MSRRGVVIIPAPTERAAAWVREALAVRAAASLFGRCPSCGARRSAAVGDPFATGLFAAGVGHVDGCSAVDPRLEQLGPDQVAPLVLLVELAQAEAA